MMVFNSKNMPITMHDISDSKHEVRENIDILVFHRQNLRDYAYKSKHF